MLYVTLSWRRTERCLRRQTDRQTHTQTMGCYSCQYSDYRGCLYIYRGKLCLTRQNNQAGASAAPITGPRRLPRQTSAKSSCQYSNCRGNCAGSLSWRRDSCRGSTCAYAHAHSLQYPRVPISLTASLSDFHLLLRLFPCPHATLRAHYMYALGTGTGTAHVCKSFLTKQSMASRLVSRGQLPAVSSTPASVFTTPLYTRLSLQCGSLLFPRVNVQFSTTSSPLLLHCLWTHIGPPQLLPQPLPRRLRQLLPFRLLQL